MLLIFGFPLAIIVLLIWSKIDKHITLNKKDETLDETVNRLCRK